MHNYLRKFFDKVRPIKDLVFNFIKDKSVPWVMQFFRVTKELIITVAFSLSPILLSALIEATWSDPVFWDAFKSNFKRGEVFIYTAAFLAPYIVNRLGDGVKDIYKEVLFYAFWAALLTGAYLFINLRIEILIQQAMRVEEETLTFVSYAVVLLTSFIWYYSIWPRHYREKQGLYKKSEEEIEKLGDELNKRLGIK